MSKNLRLRRLTAAALLAAFCYVATTFLRIPTVLGYINLGDAFVLLGGGLLGPLYGGLAGGIGSGLSDLFGYPQYAPVTLVVKGAMGLLLGVFARWAAKRPTLTATLLRLLGAVLAECVMIGGYLAYETVLYGFGAAVAAVPFNALQGAVGILLFMLLFPLLDKPFRKRI